MHLTDEELILHFYGEGPVNSEPDVDEHVRTCAACQAAWTELSDALRLVDAAAVPEPDSTFEHNMWARVQQALPARDDLRSTVVPPLLRAGSRGWFAWFVPAGSLAALLIVAVLAGRTPWPHRTAVTPAPRPVSEPTATDTARTRERVLLTALDDHFEQSEMLLMEVMNTPDAAKNDLGLERATADELLGSSRLYRASAQQNGDDRLAAMLEDLEGVLVEIARSPDKVDRRDFNSLRARIENDDLLFKVRAVSKQIHDRRKSLSTE